MQNSFKSRNVLHPADAAVAEPILKMNRIMRTKPELRCYATDNNINPITTGDPRGSQAARGKSEQCVRIQLWIRLKQPVILSCRQPPRIQLLISVRQPPRIQLLISLRQLPLNIRRTRLVINIITESITEKCIQYYCAIGSKAESIQVLRMSQGLL